MDFWNTGIAPVGSPPLSIECPRLWRDCAAPGFAVDPLDDDDGVLDEALVVGVDDVGVSLEDDDFAVGVDFAVGDFAALLSALPSLPPPESAATAIPARTSASSAASAMGRARLRRGAGRPSPVGGPERGGGEGGGGARGAGVGVAGAGVASGAGVAAAAGAAAGAGRGRGGAGPPRAAGPRSDAWPRSARSRRRGARAPSPARRASARRPPWRGRAGA